jgi:hypothetical protein
MDIDRCYDEYGPRVGDGSKTTPGWDISMSICLWFVDSEDYDCHRWLQVAVGRTGLMCGEGKHALIGR